MPKRLLFRVEAIAEDATALAAVIDALDSLGIAHTTHSFREVRAEAPEPNKLNSKRTKATTRPRGALRKFMERKLRKEATTSRDMSAAMRAAGIDPRNCTRDLTRIGAVLKRGKWHLGGNNHA
jgi:hypothetical protein